jgi:transposase-like protein
MLTHFHSLFDLFEAFPDEQSCIDHLRSIRWRDGEFCPYCGAMRIYHFSDRKTFKCGDCRERFSIKVGTIFQDTKLPLRKWFAAIWMITNHPKGIASTTIAKDLHITQKTGWFLLHRIRHAARTNSFNAPLKGTVESDTTFVGGKNHNRHAKDRKPGQQGGLGKEVVLGMVERDGELRAEHVTDNNAPTLRKSIRENVAPGSRIMSDGDASFRMPEYKNEWVEHNKGEYVRGEAHTQTIDSVWALLKRQIIGVHHWVSAKHLQKYVNEMAWRFNRRDMKPEPRMNDIFSSVGGHLTYKVLIA